MCGAGKYGHVSAPGVAIRGGMYALGSEVHWKPPEFLAIDSHCEWCWQMSDCIVSRKSGWGSCPRPLKRSKDVYKNRLRNRITGTGKNIKVMEEHLQCSKLMLLARWKGRMDCDDKLLSSCFTFFHLYDFSLTEKLVVHV